MNCYYTTYTIERRQPEKRTNGRIVSQIGGTLWLIRELWLPDLLRE